MKFRMYLKDRHFLRSSALLTTVKKASWYADGRDSDLIATISLTRDSFEMLLSKFKQFYTFKSGPRKSGRPPRVRDHHCVLSLLLHSSCSPVDRNTWSDMYGIAPSTLSRPLIKAEIALLQTLSSMKEAEISWSSKEDQIRMVLLVEKKVSSKDGAFALQITY